MSLSLGQEALVKRSQAGKKDFNWCPVTPTFSEQFCYRHLRGGQIGRLARFLVSEIPLAIPFCRHLVRTASQFFHVTCESLVSFSNRQGPRYEIVRSGVCRDTITTVV